jgi:hypothetical protein
MSVPLPVYTISLPEYKSERQTDWLSVGRKLDRLIITHFEGKRLGIRCIGLVDHPDRTLEELVSVILELGTDKYDPHREGLYYSCEEVSHIWAGPCLVTQEGLTSQVLPLSEELEGSFMAEVTLLFYEGALADRGYSVRVDVVMLYDLDQLQPVNAHPPDECYEFAFKYPDRKQEALLGVIKILRE